MQPHARMAMSSSGFSAIVEDLLRLRKLLDKKRTPISKVSFMHENRPLTCGVDELVVLLVLLFLL
jgi:hypothetical protein